MVTRLRLAWLGAIVTVFADVAIEPLDSFVTVRAFGSHGTEHARDSLLADVPGVADVAHVPHGNGVGLRADQL
jgi:hypothetical protein